MATLVPHQGSLRTSHGLVHNHPRDWFSVLFLFRRVNAMGLGINGKTMDSMLDAKVFQLAVVVWIVLMENGQGAAVARDIDAAETGIEFDDIWSVSQRKKGDGRVLVQIEDGHQVVLFARKKRAVMLRVERHSVIALALPNGISPYHLVCQGSMTAKMFWSCRLTYTLRAMGSYCGIPVSLSKCNVPTISSFCTSTMASALPRSSET